MVNVGVRVDFEGEAASWLGWMLPWEYSSSLMEGLQTLLLSAYKSARQLLGISLIHEPLCLSLLPNPAFLVWRPLFGFAVGSDREVKFYFQRG